MTTSCGKVYSARLNPAFTLPRKIRRRFGDSAMPVEDHDNQCDPASVRKAKRVLLRKLRSERTVCLSDLSLAAPFTITCLKMAASELAKERVAHNLASPAETYSYL